MGKGIIRGAVLWLDKSLPVIISPPPATGHPSLVPFNVSRSEPISYLKKITPGQIQLLIAELSNVVIYCSNMEVNRYKWEACAPRKISQWERNPEDWRSFSCESEANERGAASASPAPNIAVPWVQPGRCLRGCRPEPCCGACSHPLVEQTRMKAGVRFSAAALSESNKCSKSPHLELQPQLLGQRRLKTKTSSH